MHSLAPLASALLLFAGACKSPAEHSKNADDETYALINERRTALFESEDPFQLGAAEGFRAKALSGEVTHLGPLGILDCMVIAAESNVSYLEQKESLYFSALSLTQERWRFGVRSETSGGASISGVGTNSATASTDGDFTLSKIMGSGANVVLGIGSSLFRLVSTGDGWDAVSDLSLSISQPLLRAAGAKITMESLTQSERSLVYQVRSYERFRRTFAVSVARRVYGVLQAIDQLKNQEYNLENLQSLRVRNERLAEAGQLSDIQADQARQEELRSNNRLVELRGDFERQLDDFKLFLGMPPNLEIELDHDELQRLTDAAPLLDALTEQIALELAINERLDVQTSSNRLEDSQRSLEIAADNLRPGLGLAISASSTSKDGQPLRHSFQDTSWSAGLSLDPAWDNLPERNSFRRAEINRNVAARNYDRFLDQINLDVREALRSTRNARERYSIQKGALELARRRVRSADLSLQAGRSNTRDLLDARESLLAASNSATSSLIDLTLARLDLQLTLELLRVDENGIQLQETVPQITPPSQESTDGQEQE
ncbi:MAG: TolC family protein [Planctomycetota bacterium]|nr:TolC family protein [Planctomycetota bacterium]